MLTSDIIHRLRNRANNAQAEGQHHLAADLRLAIAAMERLQRELHTMRVMRRSLSEQVLP